MDNSVCLYIADNYKVNQLERKSCDLNLAMSQGKVLDLRHLILSDVNLDNFDFYYNYLDLVEVLSRTYPDSKPCYLLDLGYIPLIMMPTPALNLAPKLAALLDTMNVPYVRQAPFSFVTGYTNIDTVDIWVHKLDMAERFGIAPEKVRSADICRRLFDGD